MTVQRWARRLPAVKSKADLVYDELRSAISSGELRPGERVNMEELGRTFGVSKIPVREAVKRLESERLLVSRAHAGVTVAEVDHDDILGVFLARQAIEELVARLAGQRSDPALVDDLTAIQDTMRSLLDAGSTSGLSGLNSRFHGRIAAASGYRVLVDVTEHLLLTIQRYRLVTPHDEAAWRSVLEEHDTVIESLRAGTPEAAAEAAREHTLSQSRRAADTAR